MQIGLLTEYGGINLRKHKVQINELNDIIVQLIGVLNLMEEVGIAHFDIKPDNIVWDKQRMILKLIDFGTSISFYDDPNRIYKPIRRNELSETTKAYAPPESNNI